MFNRSLHLRAITTIDATGLLVGYTCSIALVLAGLGVWGLALGAVARSFAGTLVIPLLAGGHIYRPSLERAREFREIVAFGIRFQANWVVVVVRGQALNFLTAIVAGVSTLGLWSLASRLLVAPNSLSDATHRVMFPAMAHRLAEGRDIAPVLERTGRLSASSSAILLAPIAASTPGLVPAVFGEQWTEVVEVFPGACLGIMIYGTIAVSSVGYLFAADRPDVVLRASIAHGICLVGVSALLLRPLGLAGIGMGLLAAAVAESIVLAPAVRRLTGARIARPVFRPLVAAAAGATAGWLVASSRPDLLGGVAGGTLALGLTLLGLALLTRDELRDVGGVLAQALRSLRRPSADQPPASMP